MSRAVPKFASFKPRVKQDVTASADRNTTETQLATSPDSGTFLTGPKLSGADILISFPILALKERAGLDLTTSYPKVSAYINQYETIPSYNAAIKRVEEQTGEKYSVFAVAKQ